MVDIKKMREDVERRVRQNAENPPPVKPEGFEWPRPARPRNPYVSEKREVFDPKVAQLPRGDRD